jgi:hypothetical protein
MVKKMVLAVVCLVAFVGYISAEPIVLQQAENTIDANKLEVGVGAIYGRETWTVEGITGDFWRTDISVPLLLKYGVSGNLETKLVIPYTSYASSAAGVETKNTGLGQILWGTKYNFINDKEIGLGISAGVDVELAANAESNLGEGSHILIRGGTIPSSGLNVAAYGILSQKFNPLVFHVNLGYKYTNKYTVSSVDYNTGEIIVYGVAAEYSLGGGLTVDGEVVATSFGKNTVSNLEMPETNGTTLDTVIGVTYKDKDMKITLGAPIAIGSATYRSYDYKIISGISFLF